MCIVAYNKWFASSVPVYVSNIKYTCNMYKILLCVDLNELENIAIFFPLILSFSIIPYREKTHLLHDTTHR